MSKIAIVVIAYNRYESLERLLKSLSNAEYFGDKVDLIISVDFNNNKHVYKLVESFEWEFGVKKVIKHPSNLGLRKHVLKCGDISEQYENIVVLEDDIFVSKGFYNFTKQAIDFYKKDHSYIAGISLYSQRYNENCRRPFNAIKDNNDVYFMQLPSSWGQIWSREQWGEFKFWYENNDEVIDSSSGLPNNIVSWPESSWKKYFIKYMYDTKKYFVYPNESLSTNFGDIGTHFRTKTSTLQVEISDFSCQYRYKFSTIDESNSIYDVYMENEVIKKYIQQKYNREVIIDLYGTKEIKDYDGLVLSNKNINKQILKEYDLSLRPHELNITNEIKGSYFKLYDMRNYKKLNSKKDVYKEITYDLYTLTKINLAIKFIFGRSKIYIKYVINKFIKN